jgi:hypothetical protein
MRYRVAVIIACTAMILVSLVASPASANGDAWSWGRGWGTLRHHVWHYRFWHHRSCRCAPGPYTRYNTPARDYAAFYYNSRGGVGRGYSTPAYSTDGYAHHYSN